MASWGNDLLFLVFNFFSTVAVTFINKLCFSKVQFGFPAALSNIHFLCTYAGVEAMRVFGGFSPITPPPSLRDPNYLAICVVVGLVTPLNNTSLKLNSIGVYQIVKLMVTPVVVALEFGLDGKLLSYSRTAWLSGVCACVLVSSRADLELSLPGAIAASVWVPLAALYKVQWGRVRKQRGCSTLSLMHAVLPRVCVIRSSIPLL